MKRKRMFASALTFVLIVLVSLSTSAQDCKFLHPTEVGVSLEYTFYNRKGKEDSKQTQKVIEQRNEDGATVVVMEAEHIVDKKDVENVKTTYEVKCEDGKFYMNMDNFTSSFNYDQYESQPNMEVNIVTDGMFYPNDLSVGQTLPDGNVQIDIAANGTTMFGTTVTIKDRKVEAKESITTPAGTFECYKVSSIIVTKSLVTMESQTIQWIAEGIGIVRSENLSKSGKLASYQLLTKIEN